MNTKTARLVAVTAIAGLAAFGMSQVISGGRPLATALTGAAEAPGPGDPDGSGTAFLTINPGQSEVCFLITVTGITLPAIAAHIHEAPVGVPGPIVVALSPPGANGTAAGCVAADREELLEILNEPQEYYVNVHTTDFPAGAVRGQLSK
jgi:CHRD domain